MELTDVANKTIKTIELLGIDEDLYNTDGATCNQLIISFTYGTKLFIESWDTEAYNSGLHVDLKKE